MCTGLQRRETHREYKKGTILVVKIAIAMAKEVGI